MSYASDRLHEFHEAFDVPEGEPSRQELAKQRRTLHAEENGELLAALGRLVYGSRGPGILEGIAEELADVMVVAYGTADLLGLDLDTAFRIKMEANFAKLPDCERCHGLGTAPGLQGLPHNRCSACGGTGKGPPLKRSDGKILKSESWQKPSMAEAIKP